MKHPNAYVSYLLRIWKSGEGEDAVRRASLESPLTGERQSFVGLSDLFAFLEGHTFTMVSPGCPAEEGGGAFHSGKGNTMVCSIQAGGEDE